jgi:hypothetical protein
VKHAVTEVSPCCPSPATSSSPSSPTTRALPAFGITPCPLTLFTFGLLSLTQAPVPRRLLLVPVAWSLIGGSAAGLLGIPQDWPLLAGGGVTLVVLLLRDRNRSGALALG